MLYHVIDSQNYVILPLQAFQGSIKGNTDKFYVHEILDVAGMVPVLGIPADLLNGTIYGLEGDYLNATMTLASTIPGAGNAYSAAKVAKNTGKHVVSNASKTTAKAVSSVPGGSKIVSKVESGASNVAKHGDDATSKIIRNPNGRKGCEAHQIKIEEVKADIKARGLEAKTETHIKLKEKGVEGHGARAADITAHKPGSEDILEIHQVGKALKDGETAVAREMRAIADINKEKSPLTVKFHPYNH